jgi:hypothetical protein
MDPSIRYLKIGASIMNKHLKRIPTRAVLVALLGVFVLIFGTSAAFAQSGCKQVKGKITLQQAPAAECASPAGICAQGDLKGGLNGNSAGVVDEIITTSDTSSTGVVVLLGETVYTDSKGTFTMDNVITYLTVGDNEFVELATISGGTGQYAGATGSLQLIGNFDPVSGGNGSYEGVVCKP